MSHALQIEGAGDINSFSLTMTDGEFLLASNKGILRCYVNADFFFEVKDVLGPYEEMFVHNLSWAGDSKYIVVTS